MSERLCLFCKHFRWTGVDVTVYGTLTGPEIGGGVSCAAGQKIDPDPHTRYPSFVHCTSIDTEEEWRKILLSAQNCDAYERPE